MVRVVFRTKFEYRNAYHYTEIIYWNIFDKITLFIYDKKIKLSGVRQIKLLGNAKRYKIDININRVGK